MRWQSRQPDRRPVGRVKRATLTEYLLKKREMDNSSRPNQKQKAACLRKIPPVRKSYSL
jgi:hypothetical protein